MTATKSRKSSSLANRALIGLCALVAGLTMYSCTASGHAKGRGEFNPPFVPPIKWTADVTIGDYTIDGGATRANMCVKVIWTGSDGAEISNELLETDGTGSASGKIPKGAVRWEAKLVKCPDPEPEKKDTLFDPFSQQDNPVRVAVASKLRYFDVFGASLMPDDSDGANNLTYNFVVRAGSWEHVENLIYPIVVGGIGTPVPSSIEVLAYSTMESGIAGGRFVSALPDTFRDFSFDFNSGAFTADLSSGHNTINYQIGSWDVVEMVIPLSAFDAGFVPGATYSNEGVATFSSDRVRDNTTASYGFDYSN